MSTPLHSSRKHIRLSSKVCTPGSEYGLRTRNHSELRNQTTHINNPQRLRFSVASCPDASENEGLDVLVGGIWNVYRVSPLNNFSYKTVHLKQYSRRLREGLSVRHSASMNRAYYDVTFKIEEGLAQTEHDKEAVEIVVNLITSNDEESRPPENIYIGYLMSRGSMNPMENPSVIHLPILLCRGTLQNIKHTHYLIEKFFDCAISPLTLSQEDLTWICAIIADKSQNVMMQFMFPQVSVRNVLTFNIPHKNLSTLWKKIHNSTSECISDEEIKLLYGTLMEQLLQVYQIDVKCAQLVQLKCRDILITRDGRFQAKTNETMNQMLRFLYEVSTVIDTAVPNLGEELR